MQGIGRPQWRARQPFIEGWKKLGLYAGRNMAEEIREGLKTHAATRVVFVVEQRVEETTAGALWQESAAVAAGLAARGLERGDAIVAQLPSRRENMLLFLAAMRLGLVLVPVVHIYGAAELAYILRASRARALALPGRWRNIDFAGRVRALGELPDLQLIVTIGGGELPGPSVAWEELAATRGPELPLAAAHPDSVCMINFTSGTTSAPKGVMHSHHSLIAAARRLPPLEVDIRGAPVIRFGPAGHIAAIMSLPRPFVLGDDTIYVDQFEPGYVAELCDRYRVRRCGGVPTHMTSLLEERGGRLPESVRWILLGATSVPPALIEKLDSLGVPAVRSWGMTEQPVPTSGEPSEPLAKRANTDGRPVPGSFVRALDDDGRDVPPGRPGELVAMGPQMFLGYLDPALDAAGFTRDGFYRSGDIGVFDAEGYVTIVDRKKDIVVRGGENISSREVEELLLRHPAVREAAVVGWPDERLGERVGVFVQLKPGAPGLELADVKKLFVELGVARQKTPEHLVVVDEFPRTASGKIIKPELRQRARALLRSVPEGLA
jgi:acyl-CoA synthetase (AMP-forming)/AMP-acid ligase II